MAAGQLLLIGSGPELPKGPRAARIPEPTSLSPPSTIVSPREAYTLQYTVLAPPTAEALLIVSVALKEPPARVGVPVLTVPP